MSTASFPVFRSAASTATDAVLTEALRGCARRNLPALQRLYDLTAPRLLGELTQRLGDSEAAETGLADCYVQIWEQAGGFSPERCRPGTWLLSIARHYAIGLCDAHPAAPEEVDAALLLVDAALGEQGAESRELHILRLVYASGRTPAEIGRALGWPTQHVRQGIRRGLRMLVNKATP